MKCYIVTDTHFGHEKLVTKGCRPAGYEHRILRAIGNTVRSDDLLINLGDFCWNKEAYWHEQYMLHALCKNWLVIGNHDSHNAMWYMSHGWAWAGHTCTVEIHGARILFSHEPQPDGGYTWNIHGHFHDTPVSMQLEHEPELVKLLTPKHILIAMEHTNYQPVELLSLLERATKKPVVGPALTT